ncbi:uncharacterized protein LOC135810700 isoform X2 [Sycon ciliatum]|uniref:uncharacterized protein LOC135810700 isoform X2 n=1 Tax=Sycon ciliatum TaxID=27933 RepID=UPI0031F70107
MAENIDRDATVGSASESPLSLLLQLVLSPSKWDVVTILLVVVVYVAYSLVTSSKIDRDGGSPAVTLSTLLSSPAWSLWRSPSFVALVRAVFVGHRILRGTSVTLFARPARADSHRPGATLTRTAIWCSRGVGRAANGASLIRRFDRRTREELMDDLSNVPLGSERHRVLTLGLGVLASVAASGVPLLPSASTSPPFYLALLRSYATVPVSVGPVSCHAVLQCRVYPCKNCTALTAPFNGKVTGTGFTPGTGLFFACNAPYVLQGSAVRYCNVSGTWSGVPATCSIPRVQVRWQWWLHLDHQGLRRCVV